MKAFGLLLLAVLLASLQSRATETFRVVFRIDATQLQKPVAFGIRGNALPLRWDQTIPLKDVDGDGIYEGEITFTGDLPMIVEYKLVYGDKKVVYELARNNRVLLLRQSGEHRVSLTWNVAEPLNPGVFPKIPGDKLQADLAIVRQAMLDIHPGLYRFRTPEQVDSLFTRYQQIFADSMSYAEAFLNFTRITSFIQCGHTFPSFYNQNSLINQLVLEQETLPITFRVLGEQMVVTADASAVNPLPTGTEILAINGHPTAEVLRSVASLVKADGGLMGKRYADLNTFGAGNYESFDVYFPLLFPSLNGQYRLEVREPGSTSNEVVVVNAMNRKQREQRIIAKDPALSTRLQKLWALEFWSNKTAYLRLGTFDEFQLDFNWQEFLKDAFRQLKEKQVGHLIIDIRWNEGGQDEMLLFLGRHLAKSKLMVTGRQEFIRYQRISPVLRPYLSTWDNSFFDLSQRVVPADKEGFFSFPKQKPIEVNPAPASFQGKVYLLVNGANSSATFYFAELAKRYNLATLIGETTGGNQQGLNAGVLFFLRLPHSQIEIDVPIIGTFDLSKPVGGIVPDVEVRETAADLQAGKDPVIQAALNLIAGGK